MENNIEESIKIMEHWIEYEKNNKEKINRADELINIQETILSAYKRVLKEKNRLEEQVEYDKTHIYTPQTIELNFISKSKIEDKIEKLNSESYAEKLEDMMNIKNYTITELVQYVLQELLDGSDTDVGSIGNSIEEEIEILEKFKNNKIQRDKLERDVRCGGWKIGDIYKCLELDNAIDNILSDYKRVLKENEELKNDNKYLRERETYLEKRREDIINFFQNQQTATTIPIQKIKNIIDRIDYDIEKTKEIISKNTNINASYRKNDYQIVRLRAMNTKSLDIKNRLQELLESEE